MPAPVPRSVTSACASSCSTSPPARSAGSTWCTIDPAHRWYQRLLREDDQEVWLLSWLPGQRTGFHDHGRSAGAFTVVQGCLRERTAPAAGRACRCHVAARIGAGRSAPGTSTTWATSRRSRPSACTPTHRRLPPWTGSPSAAGGWSAPRRRRRASGEGARTALIGDVLDAARERLHRLGPAEAFEAVAAGRCSWTSGRRPSGPLKAWCPGRCTWSATCWNGGSTPAASREAAAGHRLRPAGDRHVLAGIHVQPGGRVPAGHRPGNATDLAGGFLAWARAGAAQPAGDGASRSRISRSAQLKPCRF